MSQINAFHQEIEELWTLLDISDEEQTQFNCTIPKNISEDTLQFVFFDWFV